jgi:hypothetical protein
MTARRAPLSLARADAFSTAASAPEMTVWPGELRFAAATVSPVSASASLQASATSAGSKDRTGGHGSLAGGDGQLHGSAAGFHRAYRIGKAECSGGYVGRPLAQRMPRGKRRLDALFREHAPRCDAHREDRRLSVLGEAQVFFRTFKDEFRERKAERLVGLGKGLRSDGKAFSEFAAHAGGLRTLPRKEEGDFGGHFREILSCQGLRSDDSLRVSHQLRRPTGDETTFDDTAANLPTCYPRFSGG